MAITVGIAAGLINAGVVFLQLTFPLLIVFLLVALLPLENNAITWSVVGRQLQGSFWPLILRADSTSSSKVKTRVLLFSLASTLGLILLAVSAVVTPLGLYQSVSDGKTENVKFVYAKDQSPIGIATYKRDHYRTSRLCPALNTMYNCPGQEHGFSYFRNATGDYIHSDDDTAYISSVPPTNLSEIFGSGRDGNMSTVASALDLQYRSYLQWTDIEQNSSLGLGPKLKLRIDQYRQRSVGRFSMFESQILADDWVIVDGLVANMKTGGIALRNHTVPEDVAQGAEWTESLLWLEPESVCVDTNLTYKWTVPDSNVYYTKPILVDNGGFVNLSREYPYLDLNDTQARPMLKERAYKGALLTNFNKMTYLNTTRNASYIGRQYALPQKSAWSSGQIGVDRFSTAGSSVSIAGDNLYLPPGRNSTNAFISTQSLVWGVAGGDLADLTHITVDGGILMGAPVGVDGTVDYRPEPNSQWTAPFYSCVTTLKASIIDITFTINQTSALSNLVVKHTEPKKYSSNATTPLWAVEDTGFNMSGITPLWGIIGNEHGNNPKLQTLRKESLYLPAGRSQYFGGLGELARNEDDAWGPETPQAALQQVYTCVINAISCGNMPDYSGKVSYPLYQRWRELTKSPSTAGGIFNLVWTDIMINFVTSGRGKLTKPGMDSTNAGSNADAKSTVGPVSIASTSIKYHMYFAVPGLIFLAVYLIVVVIFIFMLCVRRATFQTIRSLANQTAVGRAMTIERYGARGVQAMTTKTWIELHGDADLLISKNADTTSNRPTKGDDDRSNSEIEMTKPLVSKVDTRYLGAGGDYC